MSFSKGKRIEDETSERIITLAVNIGCKEGVDALTVTRLCKELNCDRRVIYNRFRDIDEINLLVAQRCNQELIANAREAVNPQSPCCDNFEAYIKAVFTYIYERNAHFQYYTALYRVTDRGIRNEVLQDLTELVTECMASGGICAGTDCGKAAENIWFILTGVSGVLAKNSNYKYEDGLSAVLYGVRAIAAYMRP